MHDNRKSNIKNLINKISKMAEKFQNDGLTNFL